LLQKLQGFGWVVTFRSGEIFLHCLRLKVSAGGEKNLTSLETTKNMTKLLTFAMITFAFAVSSANAQFSTNFAGDQIGNSDFTEADGNGFSALFDSPGEVVFFNNGSLYDASNRAFGVAGGQTSTISFSQAANVSVSGLDTNGQVTGGSPAGTVAPGSTLSLANGSIEAFDSAGGSLGVFTLTEGGFTNFDFSGPVSSLELTNAGPVGSFSLLGSISASAATVPEPSSGILLAGLASLVSLRRRRN